MTKFRNYTAILCFLLGLAAAASRSYHYPQFDMDMLGYLANVAAKQNSDPKYIHDTVYGEVRRQVPAAAREHLLGNDDTGSPQEKASRHERAVNPYRFVQFLPCFAIRPLYIELLFLLHRMGVGLIQTTTIVSVVSYGLLGVLIFLWATRYLATPLAALLCFLLVISPPVLGLAHHNGPDAFSAALLLLAFYLLFERVSMVPGLAVLLASVYVRTDNAILVLVVLAYFCLLTDRLSISKAFVLGGMAIASVFLINHFAGDYGWRMLYYRAFIAPPLAPGEFVAQFTFSDYLHALRSGISSAINDQFIPFLLAGVVGVLAPQKRQIKALFGIALLYSAARFIIFPLPEPRYFSVFFLIMGLTAITAVANFYPASAERSTAAEAVR